MRIVNDMKRLKTLLVQFENKIPSHQTAAFRGAIIEKVGRENILFHQHKGDTALLYAYPLIQYKVIQGQASMICLGDGVNEIHKLFNQEKWNINVNGEKMILKIDRLDLNHIILDISDKITPYQIKNWIGLNERNYALYNSVKTTEEKISILEKILIGNIISFAKGMEWEIDQKIELKIKDIISTKQIKFKGIPLMAFDLDFECNVSLPDYIGLGKSVSHGYGIINNINEFKNRK